MKPFCVMLLSLVLLATQFLGGVAAGPQQYAAFSSSTSSRHSCCPPAEAVHCHAACCVTPASAPTPPIAPVPPSSNFGRILLEVPSVAALLWALPPPSVHPPLPASFAWDAVSLSGEPLYLRLEALLI